MSDGRCCTDFHVHSISDGLRDPCDFYLRHLREAVRAFLYGSRVCCFYAFVYIAHVVSNGLAGEDSQHTAGGKRRTNYKRYHRTATQLQPQAAPVSKHGLHTICTRLRPPLPMLSRSVCCCRRSICQMVTREYETSASCCRRDSTSTACSS